MKKYPYFAEESCHIRSFLNFEIEKMICVDVDSPKKSCCDGYNWDGTDALISAELRLQNWQKKIRHFWKIQIFLILTISSPNFPLDVLEY